MSLIISDEIVKASKLSEDELLLEIIVMLFQQEKIGLGKAAELLKMPQMRFQRLIADRGICVHYNVEDFEQDIKNLREMGRL